MLQTCPSRYFRLPAVAVAFVLMAFHVPVSFADELPQQIAIQFDEPAARVAKSIRWPVTLGVPLPEGKVLDASGFQLRDGSAKPIGLQTKPLSHWPKQRDSIEWLRLDFQTDFGSEAKQKVTLHTGGAAGDSPMKSQLQVTESPDTIHINTGAIAFDVSKEQYTGLSNLTLADGKKVLDQTNIFWVDQDNQRYETQAYRDHNVRIESQGTQQVTLLADGWYASPDHEWLYMKMRYQVRITAFAGLPYVRMYVTHIWTEESDTLANDWGIDFVTSNTAANAAVGRMDDSAVVGAISKDAPMTAVQETFGKGAITFDSKAKQAQHLAGWASVGNDASGLAVSLLDMPYEIPKQFTASPNKLTLHFWAPAVGPMSMHEDARMQSPDVSDAHREWLKFNKTVSPMGVAKTHELWLWPTGATLHSPDEVNDMVQNPPAAMAAPAYQCSTDAIEQLRPASETPEQYRFVETAIDNMFDYIAKPLDRLDDFDMWNFGEVHLFSGGPWRTWDIGGYNWPQTPWMLYYRSGHRKYIEHGRRNARHVMDVGVCHHGKLHGRAAEKVIGFKHMYSPLSYGWGPYGDNFHTHLQYLLYYHYLTGYERANDVAQLMARCAVRNVGYPDPPKWKERDFTVSRSQYGQINPKTVYYRATGDSVFETSATKWAELAILYRDANNTFINNNFWNFFHRGLINTYHLFGYTPARDALLDLAKPYSQTYADAQLAPVWGRELFLALPFAYRETGDESYLHYASWHVKEQARLVQTEGDPQPWEGGRGYTGLKRTQYPHYIDHTLATLAAWHDAGWKDYEPWPGNHVQWRSHTEESETYKSAMILIAKKETNKAGEIQLRFRLGNLGRIEKFNDRKQVSEVTLPDGSTRLVNVSLDEDVIAFAADDPTGVYRVIIRAELDVFWASPTTTLSKLVIHAPNGLTMFNSPDAPARLYGRFADDAKQLDCFVQGARVKELLPLRIADGSNKQIGMLTQPSDRKVSIAVPADLAGKPAMLTKGMHDYVPWDASPLGVSIDGMLPYYALQPELWFNPEK